MKKIYLIILISICINAFSQTIEVPERKKALLFKSTATWCGPCGWYHYVTDSIYNNHSDSILFLNGHVATSAVGDPYSGPMHNLLNAVPGNSGIPHYSVAGQWVDIWPPTYDELMGAAEIFFSQAIIANIAFNYEIVGNDIIVNTTTEFFQDAEGDFLVGAMVVENNIMTYQNTGNEYVDMLQHRIQRTVLGTQNTYSFGKLWADEIASGPVTAGTKFDHLLSGTLNPDWNYDELEVIVVIWLRPTGTEEHFALSSEDVEAGNSGNSQEIDLNLGYQFVSSNLSPENSNMIEVLENNLNDNLDFVRNSQGNMLRKIGPNWVNNIGDWISTEGYLFKMAGDDMVTINGTSVDPQTSIDLHTGYQFVSYLPTMVLNALDAFENILTVNLGFIRNSNGNVLRKIGPNWVNGIGDVSPGEGYLIKMLADDILIYNISKSARANSIEKPKAVHYNFEGGNAADPVYTLYVSGLEIGDEVAAFDGEKIIGSTKITSNNVFENELPAFSTLTDGKGYIKGNPIILKAWSNTSKNVENTEFTIDNISGAYTENVYPTEDGQFSVVNITKSTEKENLIAIFPNPAEDIINISCSDPTKNITIFNLCGQSIYQGNNSIINTSNFKSGIYILKVEAKDYSICEKITIK